MGKWIHEKGELAFLFCLGFVREVGGGRQFLHFLGTWHKFPNLIQNDYIYYALELIFQIPYQHFCF